MLFLGVLDCCSNTKDCCLLEGKRAIRTLGHSLQNRFWSTLGIGKYFVHGCKTVINPSPTVCVCVFGSGGGGGGVMCMCLIMCISVINFYVCVFVSFMLHMSHIVD